MNTHGIASRLDPVHAARVQAIWDHLDDTCGLNAIRRTPIPHLSWMIGEDFDFDRLEPALEAYLAGRAPLQVRTTGLGVFTGSEDIVLYVAVIKDDGLTAFHRSLWAAVRNFVGSPVAYYLPDNWVPHITLAHSDVDADGLACAARFLAQADLHWTIEIAELSVIQQTDTDAVEHVRIALSARS